MNTEVCDVLIVGAGPAGLVSALELLRSGIKQVILLEKGKSIHQRYCYALASGKCRRCKTCSLLSGVGGASGMLGGKLCFFPAGERLAKYSGYSSDEANQKLLTFLERNNLLPLLDILNPAIYKDLSQSNGLLRLKNYYAHPLLRPVLQRFFYGLYQNVCLFGGIVKTCAETIDIVQGKGGNRFSVIYNQNGKQKIVGVRKSVIMATGRSGVHSLSHVFSNLGITRLPNTVDVGVRLEFPSECMKGLPPNLQDPKFKIHEGKS